MVEESFENVKTSAHLVPFCSVDDTVFDASYHVWRHQFGGLSNLDEALITAHLQKANLPVIQIFWRITEHIDRFDFALLIGSLKNQLFSQWRLYLIVPSALSQRMRQIILDAATQDVRICGLIVDDDLNCAEIQANTIPSLLVEGEGQLAPHALYLFALQVQAGKEFAYADEDVINILGRHSPLFKPGYSPELARQFNYFGSFGLIASRHPAAVQAVQGFVNQTADLADTFRTLSFLKAPQVGHIPFVLLHAKRKRNYVPSKPLQAESIQIAAATDLPSVTIIIPTKNHLDFLQPCLTSIFEKTTYPVDRYDIIVVDNGSTDEDVLSYINDMVKAKRIKLLKDASPFNFSRLNNQAVQTTKSEVLVFLNNDTVVDCPQWLELLVDQAIQDDVGAVGAKLLYPDRTVQHGGMILGVNGTATHSHWHKTENDVGYMGLNAVTHEVSAVTGACLAMRRDVFVEVGGFDEALQIAFNDVLLCLASLNHGYRNIYIHRPLLIHLESKTRGFDDTPEKVNKYWCEDIYARRKLPRLFKNDFYYNPNLSLGVAYQLAQPTRAIKPWLFFKPNNLKNTNILLLNALGLGKDQTSQVVENQARYFAKLGCKVFVDGHRADNCLPSKHEPLTTDPLEMAKFAVQNNIQCLIIHGSPFYSCSRWLGLAIPMIAFDYGDLASEPLTDMPTKTDLIREKNFSLCVVEKIYTFSELVKASSAHAQTMLMPSNEGHLLVLANAVEVLLNQHAKFLQLR
jgi:GT2 family glycosyltransferase